MSLEGTALTQVAEHYKLTVTSGMKMGKSCRSYLCEEQLVFKDEADIADNNAANLNKLEL